MSALDKWLSLVGEELEKEDLLIKAPTRLIRYFGEGQALLSLFYFFICAPAIVVILMSGAYFAGLGFFLAMVILGLGAFTHRPTLRFEGNRYHVTVKVGDSWRETATVALITSLGGPKLIKAIDKALAERSCENDGIEDAAAISLEKMDARKAKAAILAKL